MRSKQLDSIFEMITSKTMNAKNLARSYRDYVHSKSQIARDIYLSLIDLFSNDFDSAGYFNQHDFVPEMAVSSNNGELFRLRDIVDAVIQVRRSYDGDIAEDALDYVNENSARIHSASDAAMSIQDLLMDLSISLNNSVVYESAFDTVATSDGEFRSEVFNALLQQKLKDVPSSAIRAYDTVYSIMSNFDFPISDRLKSVMGIITGAISSVASGSSNNSLVFQDVNSNDYTGISPAAAWIQSIDINWDDIWSSIVSGIKTGFEAIKTALNGIIEMAKSWYYTNIRPAFVSLDLRYNVDGDYPYVNLPMFQTKIRMSDLIHLKVIGSIGSSTGDDNFSFLPGSISSTLTYITGNPYGAESDLYSVFTRVLKYNQALAIELSFGSILLWLSKNNDGVDPIDDFINIQIFLAPTTPLSFLDSKEDLLAVYSPIDISDDQSGHSTISYSTTVKSGIAGWGELLFSDVSPITSYETNVDVYKGLIASKLRMYYFLGLLSLTGGSQKTVDAGYDLYQYPVEGQRYSNYDLYMAGESSEEFLSFVKSWTYTTTADVVKVFKSSLLFSMCVPFTINHGEVIYIHDGNYEVSIDSNSTFRSALSSVDMDSGSNHDLFNSIALIPEHINNISFVSLIAGTTTAEGLNPNALTQKYQNATGLELYGVAKWLFGLTVAQAVVLSVYLTKQDCMGLALHNNKVIPQFTPYWFVSGYANFKYTVATDEDNKNTFSSFLKKTGTIIAVAALSIATYKIVRNVQKKMIDMAMSTSYAQFDLYDQAKTLTPEQFAASKDLVIKQTRKFNFLTKITSLVGISSVTTLFDPIIGIVSPSIDSVKGSSQADFDSIRGLIA